MKTWGYNREDIDLHSVSKLPASQFPNLPKIIILIPEQKADHRYKFGSPFKIHL